mmetsp:Transcript_19877/g.40706  ORF Transcript_19877/g.40706 Transcript_19877/m.40706 type:complete len:395 (-) Transcript_19877:648-1832(-)
MARRNVPAYVDERGVLNRGGDPSAYRSYRSSLWKFVDWNRATLVFVAALVLFVTNPSNGVVERCFLSYHPDDQWLGRPRATNYGIFSLEESIEGVTVSAMLTRSGLCPFSDPAVGSVCGAVADSMCHRRPFFPWEYPPWQRCFKKLARDGFRWSEIADATADFIAALADDRLHAIHRFLCALLIGSAVWGFCCPRFPPLRHVVWFRSGAGFPPTVVLSDLLESLFPSPSTSTTTSRVTNLLRDLFYQNVYVYPALAEVNRILPKLRTTSWLVRPTGNETADCAIAAVLLVLVLGAGSNLLASKITGGGRRSVVGFSSVAGVALGYVVRITSSGGGGVLATLQKREIGFAHAFWSNVAWAFVLHPGDWYLCDCYSIPLDSNLPPYLEDTTKGKLV